MKTHVTLLLIGDDGVGKSSLISSYISRTFPQSVPQVIADANMPSDTSNGSFITIMDSSSRLVDREVLTQKMKIADCIIALYDSTRLETLESLSNIWLPLIMNIINDNNTINNNQTMKSVVISSTKIDQINNNINEEEKLLRLLLTNYPIVSACCRSSSKLVNVNSVFYHAISVVIYPLSPIYNIYTSQLTNKCLYAYLHIFRIFDQDYDNLLSDNEIISLNQKCFNGDIIKLDELNDIKMIVYRENSNSIINNCLTFIGLVQIIKIYIEDSRPQLPWDILRRFDYDDNLNLQLPDDLEFNIKLKSNEITILSNDAIEFLYHIYNNAINQLKTDGTNIPINIEYNLTNDFTESEKMYNKAISYIFAITETNPWLHFPSFEIFETIDSNQLNITLKHKYLLIAPSSKQLGNYVDIWILHWYMFSLYNPSLTQNLLYSIGYVDRHDKGIIITNNNTKKSLDYNKKDIIKKQSIIKICLLGLDEMNKQSFIYNLSNLSNYYDSSNVNDDIITGGCLIKSLKNDEIIHMIITSIPYNYTEQWILEHGQSCNLAIILINNNNKQQFDNIKILESYLPNTLPRIYISNTIDISKSIELNDISKYLLDNQLPNLYYISIDSNISIKSTLSSILSIIDEPNKGIPIKYRKKNYYYWKWLVLSTSIISIATISKLLINYYDKDFYNNIYDKMKYFINKFNIIKLYKYIMK